MAVTASWFGNGLKSVGSGSIVWTSDTIKVALLNTSYAVNLGTHDFFDDVSTFEIAGAGYTAGGATLGTKSVSYNSGTKVTGLVAADTSWASSTLTAYFAVVYKDTGAAATSPLLGYVNLDGARISDNGTFLLDWDAAGVLTLTAT